MLLHPGPYSRRELGNLSSTANPLDTYESAVADS